VQTADFDYVLPPELIAQHPVVPRNDSRLLVLDRSSGRVAHRSFEQFLDVLHPGDLLVLNNSKVIPARLAARTRASGAPLEVLLLEETGVNDWWALVRPGKRARLGMQMAFAARGQAASSVQAQVTELNGEGHRRLRFTGVPDIRAELDHLGEVPLPPYIERPQGPAAEDRERYQTVFAREPGSVAAPTAGLHFTQALLERLRAAGIQTCFVTLHVGVGTFAPVKAAQLSEHRMHEERFTVPSETVVALHQAKLEGRRIVAVGTTALRTLESAVSEDGQFTPIASGRTRLFIRPPWRFGAVGALLTNFHLPRSTLLMLVSAFAAPEETRGREVVLAAYAEAIRARYRFFSYGDAMFIQ
jgi:S-adenosylmethionine:tRNA ribosyltransferase-isomerase